MAGFNAVVRLRASARALLSALFRDQDPTPQTEALESELVKIQTSLSKLATATLNDHRHEFLDWGDFLDDLQSVIDELRSVLENADDWAESASTWGGQYMIRFGQKVPVYTLLLDAALAAVRYASSAL